MKKDDQIHQGIFGHGQHFRKTNSYVIGDQTDGQIIHNRIWKL